jgi:hypothetical protein
MSKSDFFSFLCQWRHYLPHPLFTLSFKAKSFADIASYYDINPYFFFGNAEKHHGWFLWGLLILIFFLVKSLSSLEQKKLMDLSLIGAAGVALYALFQKL